MAKRTWKFVGGPKSARTSLKAAVSAVIANHEGETAIFNSQTGELYDLTGTPFPPIRRHQYDKIVDVLGILLANYSAGLEIPRGAIPPIIAQCGGEVFEDVKSAATELVKTLKAAVGDENGSESTESE